MNRKKTRNRIEEVREEPKSDNGASKLLLFKLIGILVIPLIVIAFIWPNPVRQREVVSLP
jgi:hypothetical protein